jgi:DNA-binding transcriptional LysR family regulator
MTKPANLSYKQFRMQQLQCLCETARLGSFVAAAEALDVSNPTVWKQVHALEREFGVQLVEPHGRGCYLTAAGRLLVEMAGPAVESIETLRERFRAALHATGSNLAIAVTPRILQGELAPCLVKFHARFPRARFRFLELPGEEVAQAVEDRRADFGFTPDPLTEEQARSLNADPSYALEMRLVAPKDHPLARRRTVHPRDLRRYPIINAPDDHYNTYMKPAPPERPPIVQADFASSIKQLVELGFGIGLIPAVPSAPLDDRLHERSLGRHFGRMVVHVIRRRGAFLPQMGQEFIDLVRAELET